MRTRILILATVVSISLILPLSAQARPAYQPQLRPYEGCNACHVNQGGGGPMNVFGADFQGAGNNYKSIADKDSDGDGFINAQELKDNTNPGDSSSNKNAKPVWVFYLIGFVVLVGAVIALFVAAAKVRQNNAEQNSDS